jgi:parvulin-like peptidyl-prolyl isomerase
MTDLQTIIASAGEVSLSLGDLLGSLHHRGRLRPLALDALTGQIMLDAAVKAGLSVSAAELQSTANGFRQRHGLSSAERTRDWLTQERLSVAEFESALERDLLLDKLKDHLFKDHISSHFDQHRAQYDRLRLRQLTVPREDLARELLSQIHDEGRDFAAVVQEHRAATDGGSPAVAVLLRRQLLPAVAAALPRTVGEVCGPVPTPHGFALVRVEQVEPAQLDAATMAVIRQELFEAWLRQQLDQLAIRYLLLDELT